MKTEMKLEIDTSGSYMRHFWPVLVTVFWAIVLCSYSAVSGRLGNAPGIMIGPWLVGSISRYYDPFILGVLVSFTIWAWKHSLPIETQSGIGLVIATVFGVLGFAVLGESVKIPGISRQETIMLSFVVVMLLIPFGFKGMLIPFSLLSLIFWKYFGLAIIAITLPILYIGKCIIWWAVNILRYWSFDRAYNKLKGRPLEGTPTTEGVPASAT